MPRKIGVDDDDARAAVLARSTRGRPRRRRRAIRGRRRRQVAAESPMSTTSGALGSRRGRARRRRRRRPGRRGRARSLVLGACRRCDERASARRDLAARERSHRDDDAGLGKRRREPTHGAAYATGRGTPVLPGEGSVLSRRCGGDCDGRSRAADRIPTAGSGDPREQSRVVSRSARARVAGRSPGPSGAVSRQGRAVREVRARARAARLHQIPVQRDRRRTAASSLVAAVDALRRRGVRHACSPRERSRSTSSRWPGSRARRDSRKRAACPSRRWGCGVRTASCSRGASRAGIRASRRPPSSANPSVSRPDDDIKRRDDADHGGDRGCVARAREIYPQRAEAGEDDWWVRPPETARVRTAS